MARLRGWLFPVALLALWSLATVYTISLVAKDPVSRPELSQPVHLAAHVAQAAANYR